MARPVGTQKNWKPGRGAPRRWTNRAAPGEVSRAKFNAFILQNQPLVRHSRAALASWIISADFTNGFISYKRCTAHLPRLLLSARCLTPCFALCHCRRWRRWAWHFLPPPMRRWLRRNRLLVTQPRQPRLKAARCWLKNHQAGRAMRCRPLSLATSSRAGPTWKP